MLLYDLFQLPFFKKSIHAYLHNTSTTLLSKETHQCEGTSAPPTFSSSPTKAPVSASPTIEPEQNCAKSGEDCKSQACCSDSVCVKNKGVSTCVSA